ncbi:hypothetical protein [Kitasatospora purpeofusca]|uniref:hypothetical protein n=1 Tax=Kitasatospora purpeofusca TaxID=67352 RepID=UPI0004C07F30|nr:hypothetical protein [Kitasatospora purpeofusca]
MAKMPRKVRKTTDKAIQILTAAITLAVLLWAPVDSDNRVMLAAVTASSALIAYLGLRAGTDALWTRFNRRPTGRRTRA